MSGPFENTIAGSRMIGSGASAELLERIRLIWQSAQSIAARSVNSAHVCANWLIGRQIVEAEQGGAQRAEYGQEVLKSLSTALTADYGSGFSLTALKYMRTFYVAYPELVPIGHAARDQLSAPVVEPRPGAEQAADLIKDPYVLEFLDLPESHRLVESKVEEALISRLQEFLLELGSGFAFVGRQVRLTLDGDHFYPDLVFYHVKLKCYMVIDLKVAALSHGDLGQMQMYVHYYDREVAAVDDNPTIGLILCTDKHDAMVQYVLDDKSRQIFASRYKFQLPSEEDLKSEIRRELREPAKK
jgi:hypothetical protein